MRLWLKDSERRPDPEPVRTDDRKPMIVGLVAWVLALGAVLLFGQMLSPVVLWTCVGGVALGILGLIYTAVKRRR